MGGDDRVVGGRFKGRVYVYIIMSDLHYYMAESNTTLKNNYPPIKKKVSSLGLADANYYI